MSIRLYDGAWVIISDSDEPRQALKNPRNPGIFEIEGLGYDIDARALPLNPQAPLIISILSLQDIRERGLAIGA